MPPGVEFAELLDHLYRLVLLVGRLGDGVRLRGAPDHQRLQAGPERGDGCGGARIQVQCQPIVHPHRPVRHQLDLSGREQHQMDRGNHRHALAGYSPGADLLVEDEVRDGEVDRLPDAVHAGLVYERRSRLRRQHLPLLLMHAHVRVEAHGQQRDHHVQLGVHPGEVVVLGQEALLGESAGHQQTLQLVLGLPGNPHRRHVEPLVVAEVDLRPLPSLPRVLPALQIQYVLREVSN